jgi:hypothetical protein
MKMEAQRQLAGRSQRRKAAPAPAAPLRETEWNFDKPRAVPPDEIEACFLYEYAREYYKQSGTLHDLRGPWNDDFLRELEAFPAGRFDDGADALSGVHELLRSSSGGGAELAYAQRSRPRPAPELRSRDPPRTLRPSVTPHVSG